MISINYRDFILVCRSLGLNESKCTNGILFKGTVNGNYVVIPIHVHAMGRDIPDSLLRNYIKRLGFKNTKDFMDYLRSI